MSNQNIGGFDRLLRFYLGLVFVACALPFWTPDFPGKPLGYIGLALMLTAVVGRCGLYKLLGVSTCPAN